MVEMHCQAQADLQGKLGKEFAESNTCWKVAISASFRFLRQLKDGEQLYASSLPGNLACTPSANALACVSRDTLHEHGTNGLRIGKPCLQQLARVQARD